MAEDVEAVAEDVEAVLVVVVAEDVEEAVEEEEEVEVEVLLVARFDRNWVRDAVEITLNLEDSTAFSVSLLMACLIL